MTNWKCYEFLKGIVLHRLLCKNLYARIGKKEFKGFIIIANMEDKTIVKNEINL